jgi:predicted MFS family arabinose efflux permease
VLLTAATVVLLLVLSWGGVQYAWSSPLIIGLSVCAAVLTVLLIWQEQRTAEPMLSPHTFHNRVFVISSGVMGLTFMGIFGAFVFLPLFLQLVLGMTPAKAGLMLAPMTGGMIVTSFIGGRLVSRTGRYKIFPVVGLAAATLSFLGVMGAALYSSNIAVIETCLIVLGLGFGLVMPNLVVAIQNAVLPSELGAATATSSFFRSLGGTFGVAMSGAIMTAQLARLGGSAPTGTGLSARALIDQGIEQIALLPLSQREAVIAAYRHAIGITFLVGALITAAAFVLVLFLPEHPLKSSRSGGSEPSAT